MVLGVPLPLGVRSLSLRGLQVQPAPGGDCGCGCGGSCNPTLRGLGASGPITSADALQKALSMYSGFHVNPAPSGNSGWLATLQPVVESGQLPVTPPIGPDCTGIAAQPLNLFSTASGLSLSAAGVGIGIATATNAITTATSVALGAATMGVGLIISVIGIIFAHHAAAVKRDLNFGCSALPAVNNAFTVIAQAVQSGKTTPAAAAAALPEIYSQFMKAGGAGGSISGPSGIQSGGQPINDSPWCNSNCLLSLALLAMVLYWQAQYTALAAQQSATPASAAAQPGSGSAGAGPAAAPFVSSGSTLTIPPPAAAAPASSPNWLMIGALIAGGVVLARAF